MVKILHPLFFLVRRLLTVVIREECREQVDGYPCATYKKLRTLEEAEAWMQVGPSRLGAVERRTVPYPVKPKIQPASHSPGQASVLIPSRPSGRLRQSSSSSSAKPAPTVEPVSKSQPASGPSVARSRVVAGSSRVSLSAAGEDVVYTDGACSGNGQHGSVAGIGVWWGRDDSRYVLFPRGGDCPLIPGLGCRNLSERCPGRQTNNCAELIVRLIPQSWVEFSSNAWVIQAIIRALETTPMTSVPLVIKSDSQYAIKCSSPYPRNHPFSSNV